MVKNKMSADDFIRNNRGIDDGKDLPEEYLRALFERISRNEIKMKDDVIAPQQKQSTNSNRILGLDNILNIVIPKRWEDKDLGTSDDLMRHMQEQFKEKARKSESVYYAATDVVILRFMIETHRDAFVTSLAKFTSLHSPADIRQKNIDAIKIWALVFWWF
ncbi:Brefeldin A-inhibited guanine nucleotide-exchange protein 3 [Camellia lanceoleosa]|uniref:Brefeldin A-inhibited guanine nucleotide-exchange protein 3 n=1 Tax=Camellia lanceoleosa TaxID=1840588 RepID=A0ACC0IKD2_9ERIC|nr:Brefeldin A-inhibited guanine nucleotide-exchange protein 3 [Camellia lanceoleosa]